MSEIQAFLSKLERCLGSEIAEPKRSEVLAEIEGNLRLAAHEKGEVEAVCDLGNVQALAEGLIQTHHGWNRTSPWRLALAPAGWLFGSWIAAGLLLFAFAILVREPIDRWFAVVLWLPTLALIPFLRQVWRTRRWLWWPAGLISFVALTVLMGIVQLSRLRASTPPTPVDYAQMYRDGLGAERFRTEGGYMRPVKNTVAISGLLPYVNVPVLLSRRETVSFLPTPDQKVWARDWAEYGTLAASTRVSGEVGNPGSPAVVAIWVGGHFAVLFLTNWAVVGLRRRRLGRVASRATLAGDAQRSRLG